MKEAKRSLIEVIIGIWFLAVVVILAGVFFVPSKIPYVLGEVTGSLVATLEGRHDDIPENYFLNAGSIEDVVERYKNAHNA